MASLDHPVRFIQNEELKALNLSSKFIVLHTNKRLVLVLLRY